jgi:hypothetical protein
MTDVQAEVQDVQGAQQEEQRPHLSLERRVGAVLAAENASSDELKLLITEAEAAANAAEADAKSLHAEALVLGCEDADVKEQQARTADLTVARLDAALPRLDALLRTEAAADYARKWRTRRDRAVVAREAVAKRLSHYREMAAQLVNIFEEVRYLDARIIVPVNESRPANEAPLQTCELYARKLDAFSRSMPSILDKVQLPNWEDSERMVWPPRQVPMSVMVAESMATAAHNPIYSDRWFEHQGDRRAEQEAEQQRTAAYYAEQQRLKEQREQHEEALAAAERSRSGIT